MSTILLDTNIVSFIFKGDSRALDYEIHLKNHHLAISFMTVAELYQWAAIRQWGERRKSQLLETLQERYILLSFNVLICQQWGTLRAERRRIGRPMSAEDAWIAATAIHYDLPLATHNPKDFQAIPNLEIITTVGQ